MWHRPEQNLARRLDLTEFTSFLPTVRIADSVRSAHAGPRLGVLSPNSAREVWDGEARWAPLEAELEWAWGALSRATRCRSLVLFLDGARVAHFGASNAAGTADAAPGKTVRAERTRSARDAWD